VRKVERHHLPDRPKNLLAITLHGNRGECESQIETSSSTTRGASSISEKAKERMGEEKTATRL
jgi:hypothetical protein